MAEEEIQVQVGWQPVHTDAFDLVESTLDRLEIPGGWLYRYAEDRYDVGKLPSVCFCELVFVPDPTRMPCVCNESRSNKPSSNEGEK